MAFHMLGMSSSQLTKSFFSEGLKPPTRNYEVGYLRVMFKSLRYQLLRPVETCLVRCLDICFLPALWVPRDQLLHFESLVALQRENNGNLMIFPGCKSSKSVRCSTSFKIYQPQTDFSHACLHFRSGNQGSHAPLCSCESDPGLPRHVGVLGVPWLRASDILRCGGETWWPHNGDMGMGQDL